MAFDWSTAEHAIHDWVMSASALAGKQVIWAYPNAPQPQLPYCVMRIQGPNNAGGIGLDETVTEYDSTADAGEEVTYTAIGRREITVSLQCFTSATSGESTAKSYLSKAVTALALPTQASNLYAAGLALIEVGGIVDLTEVLETAFQGRASVDVRFAVTDTATEQTGYIAEADVTENYTD